MFVFILFHSGSDTSEIIHKIRVYKYLFYMEL